LAASASREHSIAHYGILAPAKPKTRKGSAVIDNWVEVCATDAIDEEDVIRFDHGKRTFAIFRSPDDRYFATDGLCTHEQVHLADGLVIGSMIECPKHKGRSSLR
jgi:MocE subfamily Rieske [2Fe-2S] domain protein